LFQRKFFEIIFGTPERNCAAAVSAVSTWRSPTIPPIRQALTPSFGLGFFLAFSATYLDGTAATGILAAGHGNSI
jgi:uncharacterized membrane protein YccC